MTVIPFVPKDFQTLTENFIVDFIALLNQRDPRPKITDFNVGGVARTLAEAIMVVLAEYEYRTFVGIRNSIPIAAFAAFGFDALPALRASGLVTFSIDAPLAQDIVIASGSIVGTEDGRTYETTEDGTLLGGTTSVIISVRATSPGATGNSPTGTLTELVSVNTLISTATNASAITGGEDAESVEKQTARFQLYVSTLTRGVVDSLIVGATSANIKDIDGNIVEQVEKAYVSEDFLKTIGPIGYFTIYIDNGSATASDELVIEAQKIIDGYVADDGTRVAGYRVGGVIATVGKAIPKLSIFTATVKMKAGKIFSDAKTAIEDAIDASVRLHTLGQTLYVTTLIRDVLVNVLDVETITFIDPADGFIAPEPNERITPSAISITEAES